MVRRVARIAGLDGMGWLRVKVEVVDVMVKDRNNPVNLSRDPPARRAIPIPSSIALDRWLQLRV
jgi:hypothetical protein